MTFTVGGNLNRKDQQPPLAGQGETHCTEGSGKRFENQVLNPICIHQMPFLTTRRADDSADLLSIKRAPTHPQAVFRSSPVWFASFVSPDVVRTYHLLPHITMNHHLLLLNRSENHGLTQAVRRSPTLIIESEPPNTAFALPGSETATNICCCSHWSRQVRQGAFPSLPQMYHSELLLPKITQCMDGHGQA